MLSSAWPCWPVVDLIGRKRPYTLKLEAVNSQNRPERVHNSSNSRKCLSLKGKILSSLLLVMVNSLNSLGRGVDSPQDFRALSRAIRHLITDKNTMPRPRNTNYPETLTVQAIQSIGTRREVCEAITKELGVNVFPSTVSKWLKVGGLPVGPAPAYARAISRAARKAGFKVSSRQLVDEAIVPNNRLPLSLR
jgi:hypothetical protein